MLSRGSIGAIGSLVLVLTVTHGQPVSENDVESIRAVPSTIPNRERDYCERRRRLQELRGAHTIADERERLDELQVSLGDDDPRVSEKKEHIEELENQLEVVATWPLEDCIERVSIDQLRREERQQNRLNRVPEGVTPDEWTTIRAEIAEHHVYDDILYAEVWPVPIEGCPGIEAPSATESPAPLAARADLPPCSLVMTIVDWDALISIGFIRVEGNWVIQD